MRALTIACVVLVLALPIAFSQAVQVVAKPLSEADIQALRSDIQADKDEIITHSMQFTDKEATAFWPLYRDYAGNQQKLAAERLQLITDYAQRCQTMDDITAKNLTQRLLRLDAKSAKLRQEYWREFENTLGAKRAAKFFQVDSRLNLLINLQLVSEIPLLR